MIDFADNLGNIDENILAEFVASQEGGAQAQSIAQIKEIMRHVLDALGREWKDGNEAGVIKLIKKHAKR